MTGEDDKPLRFTTPPSSAEMAAMAERGLAAIPPTLRRHIDNVAISIEDLADDATLDEMEIESPFDLTGLYRGTPLGLRDSGHIAHEPDMIVLYRHAILLEWIETDENLESLVRSVLIHEIAHHFGFSDAEIEALEGQPD